MHRYRLAPFMSIIKDPFIYDAFDKVILVHSVRLVSELAYKDVIEHELPENEFFGEEVRNKLVYYPTVTREDFHYQSLKRTGKMIVVIMLVLLTY